MTTATQPRRHKAPVLLDVRAVAEMLDCSVRHIFRLARKSQFPAPVRVGQLVRWQRVDVEAWVAADCPSVERDAP